MKKIIFALCLGLLQSCHSLDTKKDNLNSLILTSDKIELRKEIDKAYSEFIDSINCDDCIYSIFINEIYPDSIIYSFQASSYYKSYFQKYHPLMLYKLENKEIYVYSGIEYAFKSINDTIHLKNDSQTKKFFRWTVISKHDSIIIERQNDIPPFSRVVISPFAIEMKEKYAVDSSK